MKSIKGPLNDLLTKLTGPRARIEHQAFHKWRDVVGEKIAAVTEPEKIVSGVLYVRVQDHVWRNELMMMSEELVEKYRALMGETVVKKIRFI
jgi:predicted nucleic acid-binding Zn ribbon protein